MPTNRILATLLVLAASPVCAQEKPMALTTKALLMLAGQPYLDGSQYKLALQGIFPSIAESRGLPDIPFEDPFLWFSSGTLGLQGADGDARYTCSRHGLDTRIWFAAHRNTSIESRLLELAVRPLENSDQAWPDGAVAQLHCEFHLGDVTQSVAGLTQDEARAALSAFDTLSAPYEVGLNEMIYGPEGYSVEGSGGPSTTVVQVNSARMIRIANHQLFVFSSFLFDGVS